MTTENSRDGAMRSNNSGSFVSFVDARSSACSSALVESSANGISMSAVLRNTTFVPNPGSYQSNYDTLESVTCLSA